MLAWFLAAAATAVLVSLRLSMALPAAAIGEPQSIRRSWEATRGNGGRLLVTLLLVKLPFVIAVVAAGFPSFLEAARIAHGTGAAVTSTSLAWPYHLVQMLGRPISVAVATACLSLSYDVLVRGGGPTRQAAAP